MEEKKYAIRFGLGAIKAVGLKAMEASINVRKEKGDFEDIFDFAKKVDAKSVNKKSIEALAKSGSFDSIANNRRQIFESYDLITSYAAQQQDEANSNQMNFFGELIEESKSTPELKKTDDWIKDEKLKKEFEAFGFFLNEHPLDDSLNELKKRGIIFSDKTDMGESGDAFIVKMAGVVAASKHRSGPRGRFAYMTISDPLGIYEAMIFDEALINKARDLLADGSSIMFEAMIRKDEGGTRILVREVIALEDFIKNTPARSEAFEDIKELPKRKFDPNKNKGDNQNSNNRPQNFKQNNFKNSEKSKYENAQNLQEQKMEKLKSKEIIPQIEIIIEKRDPIFDIKSFLSSRKAPQNFEKFTKVLIKIEDFKVELPEKYILDEGDISSLKGIKGVSSVSF